MNCSIREANAMRGDPAARGQLYLGTKGSLVLSGGYEVVPENKIDPVNDIPRFQGHPTGGPVYTDIKPEPWIQASKGGVSSDARYGTGGEDTMAMNERDWLDSMRSAQASVVRGGGRTSCSDHLQPGEHVPAAGPVDSMGPGEGSGHRRQRGRRHVRAAISRTVGRRAPEYRQGIK